MTSAGRPGVKKAPSRVIIEGVSPEIDQGRFPIKRTVGEEVVVSADIFAEGHDVLKAIVKYRTVGAPEWSEAPMAPLVNDRWTGSFPVEGRGRIEYTIEAWVDRFNSWHKELGKKAEAKQDVASELLEGAELVREGAARATGSDAEWLKSRAAVKAEQVKLGLPADSYPTAELVARLQGR